MTTDAREKCFLCFRPLKSATKMQADTRDDQIVYVGPDCYNRIQLSGDNGIPVSHSPGLFLYPLSKAVKP
jgi:hypothetical protein